MTEQILKDHQAMLDLKFHEYKLAALTGIMANSETHFRVDNETYSDSVARACDMMARAMEKLDQAEGGP